MSFFTPTRSGLLIAALLGSLAADAGLHAASVFGSRERVTPALVGIFYDFKQNQKREPTPKPSNLYRVTIDDFLTNGLNEQDLSGFFRAGLPLYATQIQMPPMDANKAPEAFGVAAFVKPSLWIVHYKGQIAPPEDGTYRFLGGSDDVMTVAINGKVVLVANHPGTKWTRLGWTEPSDVGPRNLLQGAPSTYYGDWIDLKASQPVDIDIIVGERPGGTFSARLLYAKKGVVYPTTKKGAPIFPLFQTAAQPIESPNFLTNLPPWRCLE
jgi:PA14 domain